MAKKPGRRLLVPLAAAAACMAWVIPAATAASTLKTPLNSAVASAIPYGMSALTYRRMLAQVPLDDAATQIRAAVARPGAGHSGLVQMAVDDDHNLLTVYWHGSVPADIAALLSSLRHRIQVRVAAARYSSAELDKAVTLVMRAGLDVTGAGELTDGSGIDVYVAGIPPAAAARQLTGLGVAAKVVVQQMPKAVGCSADSLDTLGQPSRCYDTPAFYGGAVITRMVSGQVGGWCSSGFGMHSTVDSRVYIVTASHCGLVGDSFENGWLTDTLGTMTHNYSGHDDAMIETGSGNRYYDGPGITLGDTHNTKIVEKQQPSAVHDWVCQSGAVSGVTCGIQIIALNQVRTLHNKVTGKDYTVSRLAEATAGTGNYPLAVDGDSGGPVFALADPGKVTAKGIIIASDTFNDVQYFMTIDWVSADFKVTVNTG
jgi:hypothetical protein